MDQYFGISKAIDEGMYADESGGNFDDYDDDMGVGSGEAMMRIDSSSTTGFMSHHPHHMTLMAAEKIVHTDFFNDFGDLFDTDNFALNATTAGHVTA
ncbi:unnamed protein product [Adineta steineri]|uniref:Uncharacterized protein n=1 Tax=Adineta steineri TaxID=433720 RepID=A0A813QKY6_9BILA|nr:unnamed protein product [Adineta steineri]CAF0759759.1 unnamed protein product [Adineta steineri]CAF0768486.1 unnamed protein product [Adineta steineri]CAF0769213.1 unnamed protein product [Adineta steineri]CAF0771679.1 unnamed protein product [Adineta steineri]